MGICTNIMKVLMIVTGICYLMSAGAMAFIAIVVLSTYDQYDEIADSTITLAPAATILAISIVMIAIGVLACVAAFKPQKHLLAVFFSIILVVLVGEVLTGVMGYVYRGKLNGILEDNLKEAINEYNVTAYQEQIDYMQKHLECCGIHNATDWSSSTYWKLNHTNTVPDSCCKPTTGNGTCNPTLESNTIYHEGCLSKLNDEFKSNLIIIAAFVVSMALVQLLALLSSCILVCRTREERNYQTLNDDHSSGGLRV